MMLVTDFLSCAKDPDEFYSRSSLQRAHAKTYVTVLVRPVSRPWLASHAKYFQPAAIAHSISSYREEFNHEHLKNSINTVENMLVTG